jgi:hypothetical protein
MVNEKLYSTNGNILKNNTIYKLKNKEQVKEMS